jgi:hypothetical protein
MGWVECGGVVGVVGVVVAVLDVIDVSWVKVSCWTCDFEMAKSNRQVNGQVDGQTDGQVFQEGGGTSAGGSGRLPWVTLTLPGHSFGLEILT